MHTILCTSQMVQGCGYFWGDVGGIYMSMILSREYRTPYNHMINAGTYP